MPIQNKILITGGLGFIGMRLAERLIDKYEITIIDNDTSAKAISKKQIIENLGVTVCHNDIAKNSTWDELEPFDFVFHGAAQTSAVYSESNAMEDFRTNAIGTQNLAKYASKYKSSVINCNSIRVYDSEEVDKLANRDKSVSEDCPTISGLDHQMSPFTFSKYIGEQYLLWYSEKYSFRVINHRMSGIVGPGQNSSELHGWISHIVSCAMNDQTFNIYGDGSQTRDILHISDFLDLIELELKNFIYFVPAFFETYNIGGGRQNQLSILEVKDILLKDFGISLKSEPFEFRHGEPLHYCSNLKKIKLKGWPYKELKSPSEIIKETVKNH